MRSKILLCLFCLPALVRAAGCQYSALPTGLEVRPGYVQFMETERLAPFLAALPQVQNEEVAAALKSADTMWYDEKSMVFYYQDSVESVVGGRANCVARMVGEQNSGNVIGQLKTLFGPDYRFMFPFRKAAGTDNVTNEAVINFWVPARKNGTAMPTKYWRPTSRSHWYWTFPNGTLFGEILFQKSNTGQFIVFEIRTRKRYRDGWAVNAFRPFGTAEEMAAAITTRRPDWQSNANLTTVVNHLRNPATLTPKSMVSQAYAKVFEPIHGTLDLVPDIADKNLVTELLTQTPFASVEGKVWKKNGIQETYAPASQGEYSIVPKGYEIGLIAVNEVSCNRCHSEVSRRIIHFNRDVQLYGEIWGEDRIFTWHLFQIHSRVFNTFDDEDNSRTLNPKFVQAGLVKNEKPSASDPDYRPLPSAFDLN